MCIIYDWRSRFKKANYLINNHANKEIFLNWKHSFGAHNNNNNNNKNNKYVLVLYSHSFISLETLH